jgi:hypothetical protein
MRGRTITAGGVVRGDNKAMCSFSSSRSYLMGVVTGLCIQYFSNNAAVLLSLPVSVVPSIHQGGDSYGNLSDGGSVRPANGSHATDPSRLQHHAVGDAEWKEGNVTNQSDYGLAGDISNDNSDVFSRSAESDPLPTFTHIAMVSGSDKYSRHHYERYYTPWLEAYRHLPGLKILEIGARAGHSLKLWDDYFTNASLILGLAYMEGTDELPQRLEGVRHNVSLHFGDQSKVETMQALVDYGPFDVIIDDGSHIPEHVMFSLYSLWDRAVKPGGLYVIEDVETSYWRGGSTLYGYPIIRAGIGALPEHSVVAKLAQIQHVLVRRQIGARHLRDILPGDEELCSVEYGMNLIALRKCDDSKFTKPEFLGTWYNETEMDAWIAEARASNPTGYMGEVTAAVGESEETQSKTAAE